MTTFPRTTGQLRALLSGQIWSRQAYRSRRSTESRFSALDRDSEPSVRSARHRDRFRFDRWSDIEEKVGDYLASGVRLVWLVDPRARRASVRYPDRPPRPLTDRDALDGEDVVPGFALDLASLFGPTLTS